MKTHSNLIPLAMQQSSTIKCTIRNWVIITAALTTATACACIIWNSDTADHQFQIQELTMVSDEAQSVMDESRNIAERRKKLNDEYAELVLLPNTKLPRLLLCVFSSISEELKGRIQLDEIGMTFIPPATAELPTQQRFFLNLSGSGFDDAAIEAYIEALREMDVFDHVDLKSTQRDSSILGEIRHFQVHCSLIIDLDEMHQTPSSEGDGHSGIAMYLPKGEDQ